jgi:hypothetical protein
LKKNGLDLYACIYVFQSSFHVNLSHYLDSESDEFRSLGSENCARFYFGTEFLSANEFFSSDNVDPIEQAFNFASDLEDPRLDRASSIDARALMVVEFLKQRVMACMSQFLEKFPLGWLVGRKRPARPSIPGPSALLTARPSIQDGCIALSIREFCANSDSVHQHA